MKKCPKCGTILDDSKKKCYMCGADLMRSSITNFGDSFNEQIGANVTTSQDNVFNNVENIVANVSEVVNDNDNVTFSSQSSSVDFFKNELNGLNSVQYDERSAIEKMFSGDSRFRSREEIDAQEAINKNAQSPIIQNENMPIDTPFNSNDNSNNEQFNSGSVNDVTPVVQTSEHRDVQKKESPSINWGNNLTDSNTGNFWNFKDKTSRPKVNASFIFNSACFVIFLIGMVYVYFHFINPKNTGDLSFGGLNYSIDDRFELKTDNTNNRYYTSGNNCAIRINYGAANNSDGFIESYFEGIKATYENQEGYSTATEKIQLNGNVWSELSVIEIAKDKDSATGYSTITKYKHVSIVHNGSFYDIVYTNTENDSDCSSMYKNFVSSLKFD